MNKHRNLRRLLIAIVLAVAQFVPGAFAVLAQSTVPDSDKQVALVNASRSLPPISSLTKYFDPQAGITVDQAVAYALEHNGELLAARKEIEAASALVKQAGLRANPKVDTNLAKTITGKDNTITVNGMLPLELGGRRPARIRVAE